MRYAVLFGGVFWLAIIGCSDSIDSDSDNTNGGLSQGADCSTGGLCAAGLACSGVDGTCQPDGAPGTIGVDGECKGSVECQFGLACASTGTCQPEGSEGTVDQGGACVQDSDCQLLLACIDGICDGQIPDYWAGALCEDPPYVGEPFKAFFDVTGKGGEFYRLPFPNDIRSVNGKLDLSLHPNPGLVFPTVGNPVDHYFDVLQQDGTGFGTMSYVFFRFTEWPDMATVVNMETVYLINIDTDSPQYGERFPSAWKANSGRGKYICHNWLALGPSMGNLLTPQTTYAAVVTTNVKNGQGAPLAQDADFIQLLSATPPADAALTAAWSVYQPLRDYLSSAAVDPATLATAAVFTTGDPHTPIKRLRAAVRTEPVPTTAGVQSAPHNGYSLWTGAVTIPFYQAGQRPFKTAEMGGAIQYSADGVPLKVADESVEFALSVPDGEMPETGWPIVIYAHGTGGDELSFVNNGVAENIAQAGAAVLGIEQVQHGQRRGLSAADGELEANSPERLFYNFLNPRAARDNNLQAAADHFQLVRLIEDFAESTGTEIQFDAERIYFFGHSQGTQGPFIAAAHEPLIRAVVLSGAGGYLVESLLGKKNPVDVASAIQVALSDLEVSRFHPLINLVQLAFDVVDPANHARPVFLEDWSEQGYPRRHVLMSYGISDTFTPPLTQLALAKSLGLKQVVLPGQVPLDRLAEIEGGLPHSQTYYFGNDIAVTATILQYDPLPNSDGHYVMTENLSAVRQYREFFRTLISEGVPVIVENP